MQHLNAGDMMSSYLGSHLFMKPVLLRITKQLEVGGNEIVFDFEIARNP